jgi:hypothetical protein
LTAVFNATAVHVIDKKDCPGGLAVGAILL